MGRGRRGAPWPSNFLSTRRPTQSTLPKCLGRVVSFRCRRLFRHTHACARARARTQEARPPTRLARVPLRVAARRRRGLHPQQFLGSQVRHGGCTSTRAPGVCRGYGIAACTQLEVRHRAGAPGRPFWVGHALMRPNARRGESTEPPGHVPLLVAHRLCGRHLKDGAQVCGQRQEASALFKHGAGHALRALRAQKR